MKGQVWLSFLGIAALLLGCSGSPGGDQAQSPPTVEPAKSQQFANPVVTQAPVRTNRTAPVPGLLQPTNAAARMPSIVVGRRDPFAIVPSSVPPIVVSTASPAAPKVAVAPLPAPTAGKLPPAAKLPPIALPPLAVRSPLGALPTLPNSAALPPVSVPAVPTTPVKPPSRTSLADAIEVSGVVQVGSKWNVIVKEPNAGSSRYVAVGDYLENGKVLVKQIVATGNSSPVVVLQQNGVEIRKSVV